MMTAIIIKPTPMTCVSDTVSANKKRAKMTEDGNSNDEIIGPMPRARWGMK